MIKPHHPQSRYERIKLSEKKAQARHDRDSAGHVRKKVAVETLREQEARYEIQQFDQRVAVDGIA